MTNPFAIFRERGQFVNVIEHTLLSIHNNERQQIKKFIEQIIQKKNSSEEPQTVVVVGEQGLGKTHLLMTLNKEFVNNAFFVYVEPFTVSAKIHKFVFWSIFKNCEGIHKNVFSNWFNLAFPDKHLQNLNFKQIYELLNNKYNKNILNSTNFCKAFAGLFFSELTGIAKQYLLCEELDDDNLIKLEITKNNLSAEIPNVLSTFLKILSEYIPIFLCFDQLDSIAFNSENKPDFRTLYSFNAWLHTQPLNNMGVIFSIVDDTYSYVREIVQVADWDRIDKEIKLKRITPEQGYELLRMRFNIFKITNADNLYNSLDEFININELMDYVDENKPRKYLKYAKDKWDNLIHKDIEVSKLAVKINNKENNEIDINLNNEKYEYIEKEWELINNNETDELFNEVFLTIIKIFVNLCANVDEIKHYSLSDIMLISGYKINNQTMWIINGETQSWNELKKYLQNVEIVLENEKNQKIESFYRFFRYTECKKTWNVGNRKITDLIELNQNFSYIISNSVYTTEHNYSFSKFLIMFYDIYKRIINQEFNDISKEDFREWLANKNFINDALNFIFNVKNEKTKIVQTEIIKYDELQLNEVNYPILNNEIQNFIRHEIQNFKLIALQKLVYNVQIKFEIPNRVLLLNDINKFIHNNKDFLFINNNINDELKVIIYNEAT